MKKLIAVAVAVLGISGLSLLQSKSYVIINGQPVEVEQGPAVLVQLLYGSSSIAGLVALGIGCIVVGITYRSYNQNGITDEIRYEIKERAILMLCVISLTVASVYLLQAPYAIDVAIGGLGGFGLANIISKFII